MKRSRIFQPQNVVVLVCACLFPRALVVTASDANFELAWGPKCDNGDNMDVAVSYLACDDDSTNGGSAVCRTGDNVYVAGTVTIGDYGLFGSEIKHRACLWGLNVDALCQDFEDHEDFCSFFSSSSAADNNNEESCPSSAGGTYSFEKEFSIPAEADLDLGFGKSCSDRMRLKAS